MSADLFAGAARRGSLFVALVAGLAVALLALTPTADAQGFPPVPHHFWGMDTDQYLGDTILAINETDETVAIGQVETDGWFVIISPDDATIVTLRLQTSSGLRETRPYDIIQGELTEVSIADFTNRIASDLEEDVETIPVRIIARLHPTRENRTLEFNLRVNDVDVDPPPTRRFLGPSLNSNRWLQSTVIDAGNGYEVRIIACKQNDDDVIFGLRVEGWDDIIPERRRLSVEITHNNWLRSTEIDIPQPRDNDNAIRLSDDPGCTGSL